MPLPNPVSDGQTGKVADHAALKADYDTRHSTPLPVYTVFTTPAEHAVIHNLLAVDHNALGSEGFLPMNTTASSSGWLATHNTLHAAWNLRELGQELGTGAPVYPNAVNSYALNPDRTTL